MSTKYMHATCANIQPWGSIQKGGTYKTLCGNEVVYEGEAEQCPECIARFNVFPCSLCGKSEKEH